MSSTSIHNSQGIQILLEAEKEAKKIIADGRECRIRICLYPLDRTRRLKEAKTEAMQEILALKEAKKQEIIEAEQKYSSMLRDTISREEIISAQLIAETTQNFASKRESVIEMLLSAVENVSDLQPHVNWSSRH
ncbi:hypothetical protein MDAP_002870 [Mitosporidium daphniae]